MSAPLFSFERRYFVLLAFILQRWLHPKAIPENQASSQVHAQQALPKNSTFDFQTPVFTALAPSENTDPTAS